MHLPMKDLNNRNCEKIQFQQLKISGLQQNNKNYTLKSNLVKIYTS